MELKHQIWQSWANFFHKWGIQEVVADFLEASGSLNILTAQIVYISQPVLGTFVAPNHLNQLADMLENEAERLSFVNFLREARDCEPEWTGS